MPVGPGRVRVARVADAAELGVLQSTAYRAQYAEVVPSRALARATPEAFTQVWQGALERLPGRHRVLLAEDEDGALVGLAACGPATDADAQRAAQAAGGPVGELFTLVVDPDATRHGHGSRLLAASVDALREAGFAVASTWVPERNEALRRFLWQAGWEPDGAWRELSVDVTESAEQHEPGQPGEDGRLPSGPGTTATEQAVDRDQAPASGGGGGTPSTAGSGGGVVREVRLHVTVGTP